MRSVEPARRLAVFDPANWTRFTAAVLCHTPQQVPVKRVVANDDVPPPYCDVKALTQVAAV
jgi:hypothetical protein